MIGHFEHCDLLPRQAFLSVLADTVTGMENDPENEPGYVQRQRALASAWKTRGHRLGEAFGAYVELRVGSPTRGRVEQLVLSPGTQVLVPEGVANGFQSLSAGGSQYLYCFDHEWVSGMAGAAISPLTAGIQWPLAIDADDRSQVSAKDRAAPSLNE